MGSKPLTMVLRDDTIVVDYDLEISFRRTIRVPDNQQTSFLPPDLGPFPLKAVSKYASKITPAMEAKGGVFLPMYQSEAMWINFECSGQWNYYMIKVYVGGVNAVSGEHAIEDAGTRRRRQARLDRTSSSDHNASVLQDYVVIPKQEWLDGIADSNGTVRQFVAMPFGSGHSVEAQITGKEAAGGIQIEVVPYRRPPTALNEQLTVPRPTYTNDVTHLVIVKDLRGRSLPVHVHHNDTILVVKYRIQDATGYPVVLISRLSFGGKTLEDHMRVSDYEIEQKSILHLMIKLRGGGGCIQPAHEMSIAAGGKISQVIVEDSLEDHWLPDRTTVFNAQILNSAAYQAVTGEAPPTKPISATTYAEHGFPFFEMYEEPSNTHGDFSAVKSIAELEKNQDDEVNPRVVSIPSPPRLINLNGPLRPFRTAHDLSEEYSGYHVAEF